MTDHRVMCGRLLPAIQVGMKSWSWKKADVAIVIGASLAANAGFGLCNAKLMKPEAPPSSWPDTAGRCRRPPLLLRKYTLKAKRGKQVGAVKTLLACCTLPLVLFTSRPPLLHVFLQRRSRWNSWTCQDKPVEFPGFTFGHYFSTHAGALGIMRLSRNSEKPLAVNNDSDMWLYALDSGVKITMLDATWCVLPKRAAFYICRGVPYALKNLSLTTCNILYILTEGWKPDRVS
ncbi:uncharacterized protein LOC119175635 [Rhipicephalus microplus]|uniref:uncharacterized protein LOC119175635 n=1 Tax=Rhipicephalus microplus TaxID=6941 RepID=UPI0018884D86|nr:uncharacterized protein LOC119175635 [Rhipicephalus microplus]